MKSSHHSVAACNDCHTPHNIVINDIKAEKAKWGDGHQIGAGARPSAEGAVHD
jgi:hypothetical protein